MSFRSIIDRSLAATVATALVVTLPAGAGAAPVQQQARHIGKPPTGAQRPTREVLLSIGEGELITLPAAVSDVWVSNPEVADVYINNPRQIHLFGKGFGEATLFATAAGGTVVYSTRIRVSQNISSIDGMLKLAMPDADVKVTTFGQIAVLTGTVNAPDDSAQAERLVTALLNPGIATGDATAVLKIGVVNRIRTATPLQVNLQVKFAEVSRNFVKNIGVNLANRAITDKTLLNVQQGRGGLITTAPGTPVAGYVNGAPVDATGAPIQITANGLLPGQTSFNFPASQGFGTALGIAGRAFGADLLASLDLGERNGQVSTLANPNLTALSGETGTFLAGGEIPIPVSQGLGAVSIEYKQYGISLAYTPTVLADGRISLRVRPEVSQLTSAGAVQINGTTIPALSTRRAETTVELGSGQSFMIAGLLQNSRNNSIDQAPGLGDVPVLGALFRSNNYQRGETELVIVITPYLVKPVNANDIVLPTDAVTGPTDLGRVFLGQLGGGTSGGDRPKPSVAPPAGATPAIGDTGMLPPGQPRPDRRKEESVQPVATMPNPTRKGGGGATPGFSLK